MLLGIGELEGGGGAERFFADLFRHYSAYPAAEFNLYFILDKQAYNTLIKLNKVKPGKKILLLSNFSNRFKHLLEGMHLRFLLFRHKIKLVHICNYTSYYYPIVKSINHSFNTKISVNIVDALLYETYYDFEKSKPLLNYNRYSPLFQNINVSGIYSWYKSFAEYASKNNIIKSNPLIDSANYCFSDTNIFSPSKQKLNHVVFASRLEEPKFPDEFMEAVLYLSQNFTSEIKGWTFFIYGKGTMEEFLQKRIQEKKIGDVLKFDSTKDMSKVFNSSKCFVSAQKTENFTSLSMLEAMASGNIIVARNVGQTELFVKNNQNGFLTENLSVRALAEAILKVIRLNDEETLLMRDNSVKIVKEVHTPQNFIKDIDIYWKSVLNKAA